MACFLIPAGEAVIVTAVTKMVKSKEEREVPKIDHEAVCEAVEKSGRLPLSRKLTWLSNMLWGGSLLLAFEHLWHGEIVPWPPFLTAAEVPGEMTEVLHEMSTAGVCMAVLVTVVWGIAVLVADSMLKKSAEGARDAA